MTLVVDASALVEFLLRTEPGKRLQEIIRDEDADLHVPALCDVEVAAGIRRGLLRNFLSAERASEAIEDYLDLPLTRHGHQALLGRVLSLRANFSPYDAVCVALAERVGGTLVTGDQRLARAVDAHTEVSTVGS